MAKPRVFVSSTYYDLRHVRNGISAFIESLGYESILFENGDITFKPDQPLDKSCYGEINSCHIFVLIIGGRYGSQDSQDKAERGIIDDRCKFYNSITKKNMKLQGKRKSQYIYS